MHSLMLSGFQNFDAVCSPLVYYHAYLLLHELFFSFFFYFFGIIPANQVWDVSRGKSEGVVGGATIHLFNMKKQLKTGKHKLRLWLGKEADGSVHTATPGKVLSFIYW